MLKIGVLEWVIPKISPEQLERNTRSRDHQLMIPKMIWQRSIRKYQLPRFLDADALINASDAQM
jgi:hypothetical protein